MGLNENLCVHIRVTGEAEGKSSLRISVFNTIDNEHLIGFYKQYVDTHNSQDPSAQSEQIQLTISKSGVSRSPSTHSPAQFLV